MSQTKIVKALKHQAKSGQPLTIPTPPNNFRTAGGSNGLSKKKKVRHPCGKSVMIPIINKELLAQLQTANLISEQELDDNNLFEEEDMEQDDPIDDASSRQNNDLLKHQETEPLQDENEGTGLLPLQDLEASDKDNLIPPEPELHPTRSFVTHELLNYEQTHSDQCCETCRLMLSLILHTVTELKEKINSAPTLSNYNSQIVLDNTNTNLLPKYPLLPGVAFTEE